MNVKNSANVFWFADAWINLDVKQTVIQVTLEMSTKNFVISSFLFKLHVFFKQAITEVCGNACEQMLIKTGIHWGVDLVTRWVVSEFLMRE